MSVQCRPEAAPGMTVLHCEDLRDALSQLTDLSRSESLQAVSVLRIHPSSSHLASHSEEKRSFVKLIGELTRRKCALSPALIQLRRRALLELNSDDVDGMPLESFQRAASTSEQTTSKAFPVRQIHVGYCNLDGNDLDEVSSLLYGHASLALLGLAANKISPCEPMCMQRFAHAVNMSNLRVLELSSNPIGTRSMVQFLEHLDTPCLTHLTLSMTVTRESLENDQSRNQLWSMGDQSWRELDPTQVWKAEVSRVGDCLAALLSEGRRRGYAPRLERLFLNGNDLGWKAVKKIVGAVLDGNRSLTELQLFSSMSSEDSDEEEEEGRSAGRQTSSSSISALYFTNRRRSRSSQERGDITPPRASQSSQKHSRQHPSEAGEHLTKSNWRLLLGRRLWENRMSRVEVKDVSRRLLRSVRVLSCKCRLGSREPNSATFPFTRLPPEIRRKIILELDEGGVLSVKQMERVISFASDPATLGFGCKSSDLGLGRLASQHIYEESQEPSTRSSLQGDEQDYGLLPHHRWSWIEMVGDYTMPRDWPATMLDEAMQKVANDPGMEDPQSLGGGGPDGRGGVTGNQKVPDIARRRWLEEQSGLLAFWEATGTYRAETGLVKAAV